METRDRQLRRTRKRENRTGKKREKKKPTCVRNAAFAARRRSHWSRRYLYDICARLRAHLTNVTSRPLFRAFSTMRARCPTRSTCSFHWGLVRYGIKRRCTLDPGKGYPPYDPALFGLRNSTRQRTRRRWCALMTYVANLGAVFKEIFSPKSRADSAP